MAAPRTHNQSVNQVLTTDLSSRVGSIVLSSLPTLCVEIVSPFPFASPSLDLYLAVLLALNTNLFCSLATSRIASILPPPRTLRTRHKPALSGAKLSTITPPSTLSYCVQVHPLLPVGSNGDHIVEKLLYMTSLSSQYCHF